MHKCFVKIFLIIFVSRLASQSDSVMINELNMQEDGLYLTPADFRSNHAIEKENITTNINKDQIDFYSKLTLNENTIFQSGNATYTISNKQIWGFLQNKTLFVNYNGTFYRVPVFGAICYFAGVIEVVGYYNGIYDPMYGPGGSRAVKTKEVHEFMMSYYDGKIISFNLEDLEVYLSQDEELFKQYKKLSKHNRRKQASRFVRLYNQNHPIYYLK